ncbi:PREDICTED: E3 ubiquitin-protein ligase RNF213-like, partial [Apaloderma vittatum]
GSKDIGSTPEQETGDDASKPDDGSWTMLHGESEPSSTDPRVGDGDNPCRQDLAPQSLRGHEAPAIPPRDEIQLQQNPAHHHALVEKEIYQNTGIHAQGPSGTQEQKHYGSPGKVPGHSVGMEMKHQENLKIKDDWYGEGPGPSSSCQPSSYLFSGPHPPEDRMTLEFVAVLSESCKIDGGFKICVVFYKKPGLCEEFANMVVKRDRVIVGSAKIPLSHLREGVIFYKYALINIHSKERECQLEHISLKSSDIPQAFRNAELYRVVNLPKTEIKADGTWTLFELIKCKFLKSSWFSSHKPNTKKVSKLQRHMEYLQHDCFAHATHWKSLEDMEQKLDRYKETIQASLGDAEEKREHFSVPFTSAVKEVRDNIEAFIQAIIKDLKTKEDKLPKLLFAFHTLYRFHIRLPTASVAEAEECFQVINFVQGTYKELRGKSKYLPAVRHMLLDTVTDGTLWIWLVPLLYAMNEKMEDPFPSSTLPPQSFIQLRTNKEKQGKVLKMIETHKTLIARCPPLAQKVLGMVALKNLNKAPLDAIHLPLLLEELYAHIMDINQPSSRVPEDDLNVALEIIASRMEDLLKGLYPSGSSAQPLNPTEDEVMQCLNMVCPLLKHLLEKQTEWLSFSSMMIMLRILGLFFDKRDLLQKNKEFQQVTSAERFQEFADATSLWLERFFHKVPTDKKLFLRNIKMWQQLLSVKILCEEWTTEWRGLILKRFQNWLMKINGQSLGDFCLAFLETEEQYDAELENYFVNHINQWIREVKKRESECAISDRAKELISDVHTFSTFVGKHVFLGDIPCSILSDILKHKEQFKEMLCACDSSFSKCITQVLEVRQQEFEQLEVLKEQRYSFLCLCCCIEDMIKVDTSTVLKSIMDNGSFKDQMSVRKFSTDGIPTCLVDTSTVCKSIMDNGSCKDHMSVRKFSTDGQSEMEPNNLDNYSGMMQKLHVVKTSRCFHRLWKMRAKQIKATIPEGQVLSIEEVQEKLYKPAIADFRQTYLSLKDLSITLGEVQSQFERVLGEKKGLQEEFQIMEESEGCLEGDWMAGVVERIENYLTLSEVVNTAKVIDALRQILQLKGDFQILSDLAKYEEEEFKKKRLDFMTEDLMNVKKILSDIPQRVLNFLRELLECARSGFTSWVKTIIEEKTQIPAFVEVTSISVGENTMDMDRLKFFRDAMVASAPIIYDLSPTAGFEQFSAALSCVTEAIAKDSNLPNKLKDSWDSKEWIQKLHNFHGSVEHSSISQAGNISRNGIFTILKPPKFKATLEDCVSVQLQNDGEKSTSPADQEAKKYSLSQLTELQNKLMLITTKAEKGREEANRFLEILEKVKTVGKLYLELLSIGNILFIDWKAEIYCNPQKDVKVYTEFGISGILVQTTRPLLEELDSLSKAMEHCLAEWKKYLETQRDTYYHLNLFTAHQLFYLCSQLARVQKGIVEPQVLTMLSAIKHDITAEDLRKALGDALMTPLDSVKLINSLAESGYDKSVAQAALQSCLSNSPITEQMLMDFAFEEGDNKELVEELSKLYEEKREAFLQKSRKFKTRNREVDQVSFSTLARNEVTASFESLPSIYDKVNLLWDAYCKKFAGLVSDKYIGLDVFGETLKHLAALESRHIERSLPVSFEMGKPILVMCKEEEMLPNMLFVYRHTETAPLPSYDEVLVCTPDTEEEEVELLVRRALSPGSQDQKIYCLLGADKLVYKVSKQLESHFFRLVQFSSIPNYRFIIFCNAKAHNSYVITAFDAYKVTFPCYSKTEIQTYLKMHLQVPSGTAPVAQAFEEPDQQQNVKFVFSEREGMGKSLFVDNITRKVRAQLGGSLLLHKTIRLLESDIDFQFFVEELFSVAESVPDIQPSIFHIDVSPVVSKGLYRLLIDLCILRHIQRPDGLVWKGKPCHLYLIEYLAKGKGVSSTKKQEMSTEMEEKFLDLFPTVECVSPLRVLDLLGDPTSVSSAELRKEQFDRSKLSNDIFQRAYQYLRRYKQKENLDCFTFVPGKIEGTEKECLECLVEFCGRSNPSWTEVSNFTHFLNFQLRKCEKSVFCSRVVIKELCGFKAFVIKFMIAMSKDFAMPSLNMSDESVPREEQKETDSVLREYQLRRKWEQESHPYVIFHADDDSMEFLGFHVNHNLDAIDAYSQAVLEEAVMSRHLYRALALQKVPFNRKFESLSRTEQLEALCRVFGVKCPADPDTSYQLTLDNTMKMVAIHLRFQCGIPVTIMGETGCGKTKLVQFMCNLQRAGREIQNMLVVRVHGGTTPKTIQEKVRQAVELAHANEKKHNVDTVLFFDEANTSEAIFAIKEVLCDHSVNGKRISTDRLKVVAACNPYKRHTKDTIEKLEKAGLGYRVRSEDTPEKLGYIPLRQLVYRVQPLPPSLLPLVWDFGELNEKTQSLYIREIVKSTVGTKIPMENLDVFTNVISASQKFLRERKDECRVASLRDIERCMKIVLWFYDLRDLLFSEIDQKKECEVQTLNHAQRALVLSVGACYYVSLESRQEYLEEVAKCFSVQASWLQQEIELCQEVFLDNLSIPEETARNNALRENVFMMVVCLDLQVPLFLVGKPGSSKSLSKTIVANAMGYMSSRRPLFRRCKVVQLVCFQCSPHSKPEGIISTFRQCAQLQEGQNRDEFVHVVLLDEIGLAEDSPDMPLKTLHPLLEDGCIDDEKPEDYKKVGFVGISNWALDPAKMNRGLLVLRTEPSREELVKTAKSICADQPHLDRIEDLFPILANFYCKVLEKQKTEFFGLRDFYGLIKMFVSYTRDMKCRSREEFLLKAIQRNFGGFSDINPLELFHQCISDVRLPNQMEASCITLLEENMDTQKTSLTSRYLLLLTTNNAAFQIIQLTQLIDTANCDVIFGSGFPRDQDYSQVCRSVNRVKICMEIGRPVVLLNIQNLYESLYDVLNQCFISLGGNYYVDLGLGTHRVKSRVKKEFRLIVIEEKQVVYEQFPPALLSRLEKHCLDMSTIVDGKKKDLKFDLETWARHFVYMEKPDNFRDWSHGLAPKEHDVFIGFSEDTSAAVVLDVTQHIHLGRYGDPVFFAATSKLVECATPDSILRLKYSALENAEQIQDLYFIKQKHNTLASLLCEMLNQQKKKGSTSGLCLQVSTHARLLTQKDLKVLRKSSILPKTIHCLFLSQFDTEHAFRQELRYCITDEQRRSASPHLLHIVLITKVPRVLGGCSYLAFDSGEWRSVHLDDLTPPENFKANLGQLSKMSVAEIFTSSSLQQLPAGSPEDSADLESLIESGLYPDKNFLNMDAMIKGSIQKALIKLEDKKDNSKRSMERIKILHNLLFHAETSVSSRFMTILKKRICYLLQDREKLISEPRGWIFRRALSTEFILEDTSFRQALWMHLEDLVVDSFAQILAVVDANNNLDHVSQGSPLAELWLRMFQDETFLKIKHTSKAAEAKISTLSMTEDPNISLSCQFPFSWVLKAYLDDVWKKVYHLKDKPEKPTEEVATFYQTFMENVLMPDPDVLPYYVNDFLRMAFPGQDHSLYEILSKVFLASAQQLCSSVGGGKMGFSPIWLHMEYFYLQDDYQLFVDIAKSNDNVISELQAMYEENPPEMFVTLDALNILLKKVEPSENGLLPFDACVAWLKSVKSIKPWMQWISLDNYQLQFYQNKKKLLDAVLHRWACTNIVYMLIDHLLHNEKQIEEKLLKMVVKQFIFLWKRLYKTPGFEPEKTFDLVTKVLKICNEKADVVYLVKGVKECKNCLREITDPAELPCGHIFCTRCILEWVNKQCKICKKVLPEDYTPTASEVTRFSDGKVHLGEYLSQMEKIIPSQSNMNHFYFMVVHCLEDFMYASSEDVSQLAESCLSTADLSAFCKLEVSRINTLQFIAQLRLSISHVATVLARQMLSNPSTPAAKRNEKEHDLVNAMKKLVEKAPTPWPQVFLMRNLCDICGIMPLCKILKVEKWILPQGVDISQSVIGQMENILRLRFVPDDLPEDKLTKIVDALGNSEDPGLLEVVFHTALTLALSPSHITHLFRNICFKPDVVKGSYLPTMPGDLLFDKNWKIGDTEKVWRCRCGLPWIVTECGRPTEKKKCKCGATVGGVWHTPTKGFVEDDVTKDKTEKGYILKSPLSRRNEVERCLSPACVSLVRALLHSSLLLGIYTDKRAILDLMKKEPEDVEEFFWSHLRKDVECLAEALSNKSVALSILPEKKDRDKWESSFKALAQPFFQELEQSLNSVKKQRMNEGPHSVLLKIIYSQKPPLEHLPKQGLINQPCMWRSEQKTTIQTLMHLLQLEDREGTGNPYPILLELLSKLENIQHVRHLPDIFRLQNALIHFFQNSHGGDYTVQQFLDQPGLSEDQHSSFRRAIETIQKVWSNIKTNPSSSGITILPDISPNSINTNTPIVHLLPTQPSISHLVTAFLIQLQNSCVDTAARVTGERQRSISAEEVKPSSVLAITKNSLVTMALTNLQYEIDEDGKKTTYFDFEMLQRQVVHRFISGKPIIKAQTAPSIALNNVRTLEVTKRKIREQLPQELLSDNQQKRIMEEARSVNALSQALATLKFLAVTGCASERPLPEYVRQELRMDIGAKQLLDVPVVAHTRLKHVLSLWQVLAARRSMLLVQMNQDPFCLVPKEFHRQLSPQKAKRLALDLSNTNLNLFLIELHEMIMVALTNFQPDYELKDAFNFFLEDNKVPETSVTSLTDALKSDILVKNILS